jgi:hypothetical protein
MLLAPRSSRRDGVAAGAGVTFQASMRIFQTSPSRRSCGSGVFGYWAFFRGSSAGLMKVISNGPVKLSWKIVSSSVVQIL